MRKRMLYILTMLMLGIAFFCCAANAEQDASFLSRMIVMEDDDLVLVPQTNGTLQVFRLNPSAYADEHVTFLQRTDWRTVSSYDPQTKTLIYEDGTAINAAYPWRRWTHVRQLVSMEPMVFLSLDGTLISALGDVEVPDWSNLVEAWYLEGWLYDQESGTSTAWTGFIGLTAEGTMRSTGLPEQMAQQLEGWRSIRRAYLMDNILLGIDDKGRVVAASSDESIPVEEVAAMFDGAGVEKLLFGKDICAALRTDGTLTVIRGDYPDRYLEQFFVDGNYAAHKGWTNLADARILPVTMGDEYDPDMRLALVGLTHDGTVLADGLSVASREWATVLDTVANVSDMQFYMPDAYVQRASYRTPLAVSLNYAAMINHDGQLEWVGTVNGKKLQNASDKWSNLVSVAGSFSHIVGLKADGTVIAQGLNNSRQCDVDDWRNITAVAAGESFTVGLTEYGMIAYTGSTQNGAGFSRYWSNVAAIDAYGDHVVGLRMDGTALSTAADNSLGCREVLSWSHLLDIAAGADYRAAGILADGTVIATANVSFHRPEAFVNLTDIVFCGNVLYGLRSDGTVVASSKTAEAQVAAWTDVMQLDGYGGVLLGLKKDGSLLYAGWPMWGEEDAATTLAAWNYYRTDKDVKPFYYDYYAANKMMNGDFGLSDEPTPAAVGDGFVVAVMRGGDLFMTDGAPESLKQSAPAQVKSVSAYGRRVLVTFSDGSCSLYTDAGVEPLGNAVKAVAGGAHLLTIHKSSGGWKQVLFAGGDNDSGQCALNGAAAVTDMAAGAKHTVVSIGGLYQTAAGDNSYGQCEVEYWPGVTRLAAGARHTLGLTQDGRVLATGDNTDGQCDLSAWTEPVQLIAAGERFSAGVTADGHILLAGDVSPALQQALSWEKIVFIAANGMDIVGVDASGKLYSTGADVSAAGTVSTASLAMVNDLLVAEGLPMVYDTLAAGDYGCIALCEDGTVRRNEIRYNPYYDTTYNTGDFYNEYAIGKQMEIADKPVAMVCAVRDGAVLYEDGTVQASSFFPEAAQWTNIVMISGTKDTLGALSADGRVYLSGTGSSGIASAVAKWPRVRCIDVSGQYIVGVTFTGDIVSTDPTRRFDKAVWHDIVSYRNNVGIRSDGTTTEDAADGRRAIAKAYANQEWLTVYADGTASKEIYGATYPIVQMEAIDNGFILQQQDGLILINGYANKLTENLFTWNIALPRGVEKIVSDVVQPDPVPGTATFREYNRVWPNHSYCLVVLPDGHVLKMSADQDLYNRETKQYEHHTNIQEILNEDIFYDIVEMYDENIGLRSDGTIALSERGRMRYNVGVMDTLTNVKAIVLDCMGAILSDGTFVSFDPLERYGDSTREQLTVVSGWTDLVDICKSGGGYVGLRSDGTILSCGVNDTCGRILATWRNVVEICSYRDGAFDHQVAGLTVDGEVLITSVVPGMQNRITKPVSHIYSTLGSSGDLIILFADGSMENYVQWHKHKYASNDIAHFKGYGSYSVVVKNDGWLQSYGLSDQMHVDTVNIYTLEGVNVTPASSKTPAVE